MGAARNQERLLFTAEEAAAMLGVKVSWLRRKAAARAVRCTFVGKHLRFSRADLDSIITSGQELARAPPVTAQRPGLNPAPESSVDDPYPQRPLG